VLRAALAEDRVDRDRTTRSLFPVPVRARATVVAQARGIVSGIAVATALGRLLRIRVVALRRDGDAVRPGTEVLRLDGDLRGILRAERTLLNYLMHLSGVATATHAAVQAAGGGGAPRLSVYGTRKTLPGLRDLQKAAIAHGGGFPHRRDLSSSVLIKSNHLAYLSIEDAVHRARRAVGADFPIEVEVGRIDDAVRAARAGADALLIDNRSPAAAARILRALDRAGLRDRVWVELSGGITPSTIRRYRRSGADAASLGSLTHSAVALPFHLVVERRPPSRRHLP
jgi:nicotinate-nucleotide pyrophosphorylase (carboxylating)